MLFIFSSTITRSAPYLIGLIFGYFIDKTETNGIDISDVICKKNRILIRMIYGHWLCLPVLLFGLNEYQLINFSTLGYYVESITKITLPLTASVLITSCHFGKHEKINKFLSMNIWKPISKISYPLYLVHPSIQRNLNATVPHQQLNMDIFYWVRILQVTWV